MPGFVTDYGECKKKHPIFIDKVCSMKDLVCDGYEDNAEQLKELEQKIEELKKRRIRDE